MTINVKLSAAILVTIFSREPEWFIKMIRFVWNEIHEPGRIIFVLSRKEITISSINCAPEPRRT